MTDSVNELGFYAHDGPAGSWPTLGLRGLAPTTARVEGTVNEAAEQAGRDPASVRVWSCLATVGDHLTANPGGQPSHG